MDLFNVLTYLNKLSLVAFFITAIVLIYQVVIMKRNNNKKNPTPIIPNFNENMAIPVKNFTTINEEKLIHKTQPMPKNIFFPIIGITIICLILVIYLITKQNKQVNIVVNTNKIAPTLVVKKSISPTITQPSVSLSPASATIPTGIPKPSISPSPTSAAIPTRIPTTFNNETVIAYITPKDQSVEVTPTSSSTTSPTKTTTLPLTGAIENSLIVTVISGFLVVLAFVF